MSTTTTSQQTMEVIQGSSYVKKIRGTIAIIKSEAKFKQRQEHSDLPDFLQEFEELLPLFSSASPDESSLGSFYLLSVIRMFENAIVEGGHAIEAHQSNFNSCFRNLILDQK